MADIKIQDATVTTQPALDNKIPVYDGTLAPTTITPEQILAVGVAGGVVAAALGADENYVTDAEKVKLANLSGTNTGDQDLTALNAHLTNTSDPHQTTFDQLSGTLSKLPMNTSLPTQTLSAGEMAWNPDERCFDMGVNGVTLQAGQEFLIHVRNSTGTTINNGTVCMAVGTIGASGRITVAPMDGTNSANSMRLLGLATEDIIAGQDGFVTAMGKVRGVDTSAWSEGDVLYTSTTVIGGLTNIAPTTGLKQPIAYVVTDHASVGTLFVRIETLDRLAFEPANTNIQAHISSTSNPHSVTKTQVGLGNVLNAEQEVVSAKGQALGYCPLDGSAKVAEAYLPDSVLGQVEYQGVWNATTNTPAIPAASTANKGWYYIVSVSGTTTIDGISEWTIGDWIISNGTAWTKIDNTDSVSSVFGRAGAIVANAGDYTASQVTNVPSGNIAATNVQAAINELDTEKASTTDGRFVTNGDNHDHVGGDGAAITEGALSFSDVTTSNVSTSRHGLMPKTYSNSVVVTDTSGVVGYLASSSGGLPLVSQVGSYPLFSALSLSGSGVTDVLPVSKGGTGSSTKNFVDLTTDQTIAGNKTLTGTTSIPLGTAAAPSLTIGNTGNGVFSPATNTVGIATAGIDALRFYAIDSVSSAITQTTVDGSDTKCLQLAGGGSTGNTRGAYINLHGNEHATFPGVLSLLSGNTGTDYINFWTANAERARITSAGALLINATSDPTGLSAKQYVNGALAAISIQSGYTGYTNYNSLSVVRSEQSGVGQTDKAIMDVVTSSGSARFLHLNVDAVTTSAEYRITRTGYHSWHTSNSATELMRLTSTGALLVGRTADATYPKLQVGNANPAASPTYTANDLAVFNAAATGIIHVQAPTSSGYGFSSDTTRLAGYIGYTHSTNQMEFRTNATAKMLLTSDGYLIVNNTASVGAYPLQVNGHGYFNGNIASTGGLIWAYGAGTWNFRNSGKSTILEATQNDGTGLLYLRSGNATTSGSHVVIADVYSGNALIGSNIEHPNPAKTQITSTILGLSVKADTADTARFWRPVNTVSAAAGRLVLGANNASSTQVDYASIAGSIETNTAGAHTGAFIVNTATAGTLTEKARVNAAGNLIVGTSTDPGYGSKIHSTAGISLGNTAVANGNVLDWYEEGTFTPTAIGTTTAGTGTYTIQYGSFTRIGNRVMFQLNIAWSAHTGTGDLRIAGLPYATNGSSNNIAAYSITCDALTVGAGKQLTCISATSESTIRLIAIDLAGGASSYVAMDTAVTNLRISGQYQV